MRKPIVTACLGILFLAALSVCGCGGDGVSSPSWNNTGGGLSSYTIGSLEYDSTHDVLYAGAVNPSSGGGGVWRCTSSRTSPSWKNTGGGLSSYTIDSLEYDSAHDVLYAGASDPYSGGKGVWRCNNPRTSPSWKNTGGGIKLSNAIASLSYDSAHDVLYAATDYIGVWRCNNPCTSPSWKNTGGKVISSQGIDSLAYDSAHDVLYAGTDYSGVWRCNNPRTSPSWTNTGGGLSSLEVNSLSYDSAHDILYAAANDPSRINGKGVWRCTNPSTAPSWTNTGGGLSSYTISSIAYDSAHDFVYAAAYDLSKNKGKGVWRCTNPRTSPSWTNTGGGLSSSTFIVSLAYDSTHDVIYAGTYGQGVWRYIAQQ